MSSISCQSGPGGLLGGKPATILHSWNGPKGSPSSTRLKCPEKQPLASRTSLIRAIPVCLSHPHLTFMLTGSAWQHGGGRSGLTLSPALCQPVWVVSCPSATAAQREPRNKGPLCSGSSQRAGGRVECVCEYFAELGKAPRPALQVLKAFCARGTTGTSRMRGPPGGRVAEGGQGRLWGRRKAGTG